VHERKAGTRDGGGDEAHLPRAELVGAEAGEERTGEHHPLEADVHDAAPLGDEAADRCIGERPSPRRASTDERAPRTTWVRWSFEELVARTPRPIPMMPIAIAPQPIRRTPRLTAQIAARDREESDEDRHDLRVRVERRQREKDASVPSTIRRARLARSRETRSTVAAVAAYVRTDCRRCCRFSASFLRACQT